MDKDNIRENENLNEEIEEKEIDFVEPEVEEEEVFDSAESEVAEDEVVESASGEQIDEIVEEAVDVETEEFFDGEIDPIAELSEEELEAIRQAKKEKTKKTLVSCGIVLVVVLAVLAWFGSVEGFWEKNVVTSPMDATSTESAREDNIKYVNPAVSVFDFVTGRNRDAVMTVNGAPVDEDVFEYMANNMALENIYARIQMGMISSIDDFDWDAIDEISGMSHKELAKGKAVERLISIYGLVAEAEKHGIALDENDKKTISDTIDGYKKEYGDDFEEVLKQNGYPNEKALTIALTDQTLMTKVREDVEANTEKYVSAEEVVKYEDQEKVTVKHILIAFDESGLGDHSDEKKAEAKKLAEEVLAKVKAGEDFDKLIEEYNDDPGVTPDGYTFADNGQMVQEFTDASFALDVGATSEIVETSYGYHIIKRLERNVTIEDYFNYLVKSADVRIKRCNFSDVDVNIDLGLYFGASGE